MAEWQARGGHLAAALPQGAFRFIALDVETACGDAASICQIGLACVREGGAIETYATYVDPQMRFSGFNTQLHGIGAEHVAGAPLFGEALARLAPSRKGSGRRLTAPLAAAFSSWNGSPA